MRQFKSKIKKAKDGVKELIEILDSAPNLFGDEKDKTRSVLKARKEAFLAASALVLKIYDWEESENSGKSISPKWYKDVIQELINKGENVIDVMFDGLQSKIGKNNEEETNSDIAAKKEVPESVDLINKEIRSLRETLERTNNTSDDDFTLERKTISLNIKYAE